MRRVMPAALTTAIVSVASGCASFATVRSADVRAGASVALNASVTTPPGPEAGWFWSLDCAQDCSHRIAGGDLGFTYGWSKPEGGTPFALGAGINGDHPYVDAYVQLGRGRQPLGVGARVGPPVTNWREHQLYARYDVGLGRSTRLVLNPALFIHEGHSPNGENPGSFIGFVQGIGLLIEGERISMTPAAALVAGRAERTSYGQRFGPASSVFAAASLGVMLHRRRSAAR